MLAFGEIRAILWSHFRRIRGCLLGVEPFESKKTASAPALVGKCNRPLSLYPREADNRGSRHPVS